MDSEETGQRKTDELLTNENMNQVLDSVLDTELPVLENGDPPVLPPDENESSFVEIHIAKDKMSAVATFYPPAGSGTLLTPGDVVVKAAEIGIVGSVLDKEIISETLFSMLGSSEPRENILIAKGIKPVNREEEYIRLLMNPEQYVWAINLIQRDLKKKKINFKHFSHLCILEAGTPVAIKIPEIEGNPGMNVLGEEIPFQSIKNNSVKIGNNMEMDEHGDVLTKVSGEFVLEDNIISINEVLILRDGVNFKTGNVHFPGVVEIYGEVEDGFVIQVEKDLHIHNTLAASNILTGGNLFIHGGGIIGRKEHKVIVEKDVECSYVESVHLEAKENIHIKNESLKSNLYSNGKIVMGAKGKVVGGEIYARDGLECFDLGNELGFHTEIYCGMDFKKMKILLQIKSYRELLMDEKMKGHNYRAEELDAQILKCSHSMEHILETMGYNEEAVVTFSGTAYPGVSITICNLKYEVNDRLKAGYFELNKEGGFIEYSEGVKPSE